MKLSNMIFMLEIAIYIWFQSNKFHTIAAPPMKDKNTLRKLVRINHPPKAEYS